MKPSMFALLILTLLVLWVAVPVQGFDYVIDVTQHPPQNPPPPKPARGVPFTDPYFGTTIVRLTDAATEGANLVTLRYAKWSPENADGKLALLASRNGWLLYNVDINSPNKYTFIKRPNLPYGNGEPRWDGNNPDVIYYTDGMMFYRYNVSTDSSTLIRNFSSDFPLGTMIFMDDEGDSSADSRYWAWFVVQGGAKYSAFSYDKTTNTILGTLSNSDLITRHGDANSISMTDSGNKIVVSSEQGSWFSGSYDRDFTNGVSLYAWCGHSDTTTDVNGNEILLGYDFKGDGFTWMDLVAGAKIRILRRPWPNPNDFTGASYGHVTGTSGLSKPGWGLYSAYSGGDCTVGDKFDCMLVFMIELKDVGHDADPTKLPRVWQIAHTYTAGGYNAAPKAVINRNGTRIYFGSRWEYITPETAQDTIETYIIELPNTWYQDLSAPTQTCSSQLGFYCTSRETQVCPGSWIYANDTSACCSQACQSDTQPPTLSVSHSPANPSETQQLTLTASATDNVRLKEIKLYLDGVLTRTCTSSPCTNISGPYSFGTHTYYSTAEDYAGNPARDPPSGTKTFTVTQDTYPPNILNVQTVPGSTRATITWQTDEPATSRIDYGLSTSYGLSIENLTLKTSHSIQLNNLQMEKTYYFMISSSDWKGNPATSTGQFTTIFESQIASLATQDAGNTITVISSAPSGGKFKLVFERDISAGIKEWYDLQNNPAENLGSWAGFTSPSAGNPTTMQLIENTGTRIGINIIANFSYFDRTYTYYVYPSGGIYIKRTDHSKQQKDNEEVVCIGLYVNSNDWTWLTDNGGSNYNNANYWMSASKAGKGSALDSIFSADEQFKYTYLYNGSYYLSFRKYLGSWPGQTSASLIHSIKLRPSELSTESENDQLTGEYRTPATLSFTTGSGGAFNPSEGCHEIAAQSSQVQFTLNPGSYTRHNPIFRLSGWTGTVPATITVSSQVKTRGIDYNADKLDSSTLILQYFGDMNSQTTFQIGGAQCHKADTNCNGCISQPELTNYIDRWKFNNQDVTIRDLISAIGEWKRAGC